MSLGRQSIRVVEMYRSTYKVVQVFLSLFPQHATEMPLLTCLAPGTGEGPHGARGPGPRYCFPGPMLTPQALPFPAHTCNPSPCSPLSLQPRGALHTQSRCHDSTPCLPCPVLCQHEPCLWGEASFCCAHPRPSAWGQGRLEVVWGFLSL